MSVLNLQVGASGNDGQQTEGIDFSTGGLTLEAGNSFAPGFASNVAARFTGVSGLTGATLNSVYYSTRNSGNAGSPVTTVAFENATAPAIPADTADMDSRTRTTKIDWDGTQTTNQFNASPDLKTSLDDIAGSISVIQVFHDDDGGAAGDYTRYNSYDENSAHAPKLDIDYTAATPGDLNVLDGVTSIPDGQTTPVDFGSIVQGGSAPQKTFTIENLGDLTISITTITVPTGYEIDAGSELDGGADTIAGGTSKDLVVNLLTASVGTKTGDITINSDDGDEGTYNFAVTGTVTTPGGGGGGAGATMLLMGVD